MILHRLLMAAALTTLLASPCRAADIAIAIHGGAGTIERSDMTPQREQAFREKLEQAVRAGHRILANGGDSVEAVSEAIRVMEDSPLFNAGKGAVFNAAGQNELDASVMDGASLQAGSVAAVHRIRNPIDLAIKVMTHSKHVMMIGEGAEQFAQEQGMSFVDPTYFRTEHRWKQLLERQAQETADISRTQDLFSTVGAVALDGRGNLAAGTSTGGMTNKRFGRVGDSPIIGAGTYASNDSCAVSATGHGEFFIRHVVAFNICNRVHSGTSVTEAGNTVINGILRDVGGEGGVIIMGPDGDIAMPFNTKGMYRASINAEGELFVGIYGNEP